MLAFFILLVNICVNFVHFSDLSLLFLEYLSTKIAKGIENMIIVGNQVNNKMPLNAKMSTPHQHKIGICKNPTITHRIDNTKNIHFFINSPFAL